MSTNLPITFEDKINSAELLAYIQQFGEHTYLTAEEINQIRDAINELALPDARKDRLLENTSVTGAYALDYSSYELWNLTLTGNTTFSESNLEPKTILIRCTGNFALTFPSGWSSGITGVYNGTLSNVIVVQNFKSGLYKVSIIQPD